MLACCILISFVLEVSEAQSAFSHDISFRQLIESTDSCQVCTASWTTTPAFCNIVAYPRTKYIAALGRVFDEIDSNDPCFCERVGSIFYAKDPKLSACTRIPNVCETLKKSEVCKASGWNCNGQHWSTFHCTCPRNLQGQLCNVPSSAGQTVKSPMLIHYLYTPLFQRNLKEEIPLVPGLYFITEDFGDDFRLVVDYQDGRKVLITPSYFHKKNYREECLTDIDQKIHFISRHHCNLIPAGNVHGYGIFLDAMIRVDIHSPSNLVPTNPMYTNTYLSAGRFTNLSLQVWNKGQVSWEWETFEVFVPYQRIFMSCAKNIEIRGCGEDNAAPVMKSVYEPIVLRASHAPALGEIDCTSSFPHHDHRWLIEEVIPDKFTVGIPAPKLPEKYSHGAGGETKTIEEGVLGEGKYIVTYDYFQEGSSVELDTQFVIRKLVKCYFEVARDSTMKVYFHTRRMSVECNHPAEIDVKNYNPNYYDDEGFTVTWTCEGSTGPECRAKVTKGLPPRFKFVLKCGLKYKYTAKVNHWRTSTMQQMYQIEISTEGWRSTVKIQCVESCGYKMKMDEYMCLRASEDPPVTSPPSWKWEIKEVTRSDNGDEAEGADSAGTMRLSNTDANLFIVPHNRVTVGKEYRIYARTPTGYSSYSFMTNKPPEGGACTIQPESGVSLETEFRVECKDWEDVDLPLTYRIVEIPDMSRIKEVEPLALSESSVINELKLRRENIMIMVIDSEETYAQVFLAVKLTKAKHIEEGYVKESINNIIGQLNGDAHLPALTAIDELTKMIEDQDLQISDKTSLQLLGVLGGDASAFDVKTSSSGQAVHSRRPDDDVFTSKALASCTQLASDEGLLHKITTLDEAADLEKALYVLHRIMTLKTPEPKEHYDALLMEGSKQLREYAESIDVLADKEKLHLFFDREVMASSISRTSCMILLAEDPVIREDVVSEDIHEEHKERVHKAKDNSLVSMATLGIFLAKSVKYQYPKYSLRKECFEILIKYDNGTKLKNELDNKVIFPEEYYQNESANVGVLSLSEASLWGVPNDGGLLGIVTQFVNVSLETNKPVDISMIVSNYHNQSKTISGEFEPPPACPSVSKLDKNFKIHRFKLPDGEGAVILNFSPTMIGKARMFAEQGKKPSYADVSSRNILNSTDAYITFSNRVHALDSDFYVGIILASEEEKNVEYTFTYRILRCAIYTASHFISRGCTFLNLTFTDPTKDPTVSCRCNISTESPSVTWFSANIILPSHSIVLSDDFRLFCLVLHNFFTALLVLCVLVALIIILLLGYRLDSLDEKCRSVIIMEDNYPGERYAYVIAVFTGQGIGSGTTSRVAIRLFGDKGYSKVHMLKHSNRMTLKAGHDDWFLMTSRKYLGRLTKVQLWHDHSGGSPEWYCKKIGIFDLKNHIKYDFIVERWFTFDIHVSLEEARMYEGVAATPEEVSKKWYLLVGGWVYSEMREKHHLASIFRRHPRSLYTRCQRVVISVTFLMTTMLVSMMFFKLDEVGPADWPVIPFKLKDVWTGVKSSLISSMINLGVVICFWIHKRYERKSLREVQNFEVTDDPNEAEQSDILADLGEHSTNVWWRFCMPHPIQYRPVVLGMKRPRRKTLSLVFLSAGWIFASLTITVTSFFVILYGLKFGPKKSMVWGLTFLTGTFSNAIIFAPLKMAVLGIVVALTFKKSYLDSYTMQIQFDSRKAARDKYMDRLKKNFHIRQRSYYKPCTTEMLEYLRSEKLRARENTYLLTHTVMVLTMFAIAVYLSTLHGVREGYYHIRHLREAFTEGKLDEDARRVWDSKSMYHFFTKTALPALHRVKWYNEKNLRVENNQPVPRLFKRFFTNALGHYSWYTEDQRHYLPPWVPYNGFHGTLDYAWTYHTPYETETGTTTGYSLIQYEGGGYVIPLSWNLGNSFRRLKYLEMNEWITNRTRCVFLEINVYNSNMQHFSVMRFIVEALPSGVFWNRPKMKVATMHTAGSFKAQSVLFLVTILLVLLVFYTVLCVWHMSRDGILAYIATWRGLSDLLLISVGFLTVSSQYNLALHYSLVSEYIDKEPRDKHTSLFSPLNTKRRSNEIFCAFCLVLSFNMCCTLFRFKLYNVMNRVLSRVYKLAIAAGIMMNLYGILLGIHSVTRDTKLGELFILQFTLREEILHEFSQESRMSYVVYAPVLYALFKFHIGYMVSAHRKYREEWKLPTFFTWRRFEQKEPKPLPRKKKPRRPQPERYFRKMAPRQVPIKKDVLYLIK